jgi:cell fate (sporulation/competence/biofilm development) regulator YlbF (YheA/YmcA/DUF963 family)
MLRSDFQLLIRQNIEVDRQFVNDLENIYESHITNNKSIYVFSKKEEQLTKIINASKSKEKVTISFSEIKDDVALTIDMNRNKFNILIHMNYIGK